MNTEFSIGFSPCPNDTYIFDSLVNNRLDTDISVNEVLADVEQLNQMASNGKLTITKLSFAAFPSVSDKYQILDAGSALGRNCGPILISSKPISLDEVKQNPTISIAIPGKLTTANLLLNLLLPEHQNKTEMIFSDVEKSVLNGITDLGLIIHESRFTYRSKGLSKVVDLGEFWEQNYQLPIPLGCIAVKRELPEIQKAQINQAIYQSILKSDANPDTAMPYIRAHAQEMNDDVMLQHIHLYVNDFTKSLGKEGRESILFLFDQGFKLGFLPKCEEPIFVE